VCVILALVQDPNKQAAMIDIGNPLLIIPTETWPHTSLRSIHVLAPPQIILAKDQALHFWGDLCFFGVMDVHQNNAPKEQSKSLT